MEVRYQRDLYRVQLCCDTEKEEKELGYPLQMCLRNEICGLLPCQIQGTDGKLTVCWDVTSRYSVASLTGEGQLDTGILKNLLEALLRTMTELEQYLIPCEYLVLDPAMIFLTQKSSRICFLCDFEDLQSFHTSLLLLGDYVLAHMDHTDKEAMRLGYGLYRLAVEETFDPAALGRLCENEQHTECRTSGENRDRKETVRKAAEPVLESPVEAQQLREQILEDFFSEDGEEYTHTDLIRPGIFCGIAVLTGILLMEAVVFFRNGRHIQAGWILAGILLLLLSAGTMTVLWLCCGKKNTAGKKAVSQTASGDPVKHTVYDEENAEWTAYAAHAEESCCDDTLPKKEMETVVLQRGGFEKPEAVLYLPDGRRECLLGCQWLIGKNAEEADICLQQPTVSRLHACIMKKDDGYYIEDLNSKNGTYSDGMLLEPGRLYLLRPGQTICFADQYCEFCMEQEVKTVH